MASRSNQLPLAGLRVLDLSPTGAVAFTTMLLGDFGADVVMIEVPPSARPGVGNASPDAAGWTELSRLFTRADERSAALNPFGRNKRSLSLNLKRPRGREILYQLARTADVVVEGFRPGVVKRLGVDYSRLRRHNSRIVYCSLSGYGQSGDKADLIGHDINYLAMSGLLSTIGSDGGSPAIPPGGVIADFAAGGLTAAFAIMVALRSRDHGSGVGQHIDLAITDAVFGAMPGLLMEYFAMQVVPGRGTEKMNGGLPDYNVYQTADDSWISIGCLEPTFWHNLSEALGLPEIEAKRYGSASEQAEVQAALASTFRLKSRDEWVSELREIDACIAPVYNLDEAIHDNHVQQRQMVIDLSAGGTTVKQVGIAPKLSLTPGSVRSMAPLPGADTEEILGSVGYTNRQIETLRRNGVI